MENKTVEMVVKDLLLADNQKKKPLSIRHRKYTIPVRVQSTGLASRHRGRHMHGRRYLDSKVNDVNVYN